MKWMRHPEHGEMPVCDSMTEKTCLASGWEYFDPATVPPPALEAVAPEVAKVMSADDEREALFAEAEAAGVDIDRRWGLARLKREIQAAINR